MPSETDLGLAGTILKDKWMVYTKIGRGGFATVYEGMDIISKEKVAIKVESLQQSRQVLKMEVTILRRLQGKEHVCQFFGCGRFLRFNYLVMSMKGRNLFELRRSVPNTRFSLSTTLRLLSQIIDAVEVVHKTGFLHRDIKPGNFVIGGTPDTEHTIYILDFGLARPYLNTNNAIRAARPSAGFRGTVRYASIRAHQNQDLCRADDLWSVLYMIVEFISGDLPWRKVKDKEEVGKIKSKTNHWHLIKHLPVQFKQFLSHLYSLSYQDKPDYDLLKSIVQLIMIRQRILPDGPFDWEETVSPSFCPSFGDTHKIASKNNKKDKTHSINKNEMRSDLPDSKVKEASQSRVSIKNKSRVWRNIFSFGGKGADKCSEKINVKQMTTKNCNSAESHLTHQNMKRRILQCKPKR